MPYLRLPLVVTFFSTDDRVHKLESVKLRQVRPSPHTWHCLFMHAAALRQRSWSAF